MRHSFRSGFVRTKVIIQANYSFTHMAAQRQKVQFAPHQWFCGIYFIAITLLYGKETACAIKQELGKSEYLLN